MKYALIFILFFSIGIFGVIVYKTITLKEKNIPILVSEDPKITDNFSIDVAPSQSIKGKITQVEGEIFFTSRIATEEARLNTDILLQGETIRTGNNGKMNIEFPNQAELIVNDKTQIDFIQTLPEEFLINIASGSAQISKKGDKSVSIRSLHLLTKQNEGNLKINIDNENSMVNLNIVSGSIIVSYNDLNLVTHTENFTSPKQLQFNDLTRTFEF